MTKVIFSADEIPIQPGDIDTSREFGNVFGEAHAEWAAYDIVCLCQRLGAWQPFTKEELFTQRVMAGNVIPVQLSILYQSQVVHQLDDESPVELGGGWIVRFDDCRFRVTDDFIFRCYQERPARPVQAL